MATESGSTPSGGGRERPSPISVTPDTPLSPSSRDLKLDQVSLEDGGAGAESQREFYVDEAIDALGFGRFQIMVLFYSGLAWVGDAMEMMLLSFVGPAAKCEWNLTGAEQGGVTSTVFVGMLVGAYVWGAVSDVKGRRAGFFMTACFTSFFGILSAFSFSYWWLILTRCLVGFGLGGVHVPYALFLEFVPGGDRGFWLVVINVFWTIGSVFEAILAWIIMPTLGWRWLLAFSSVPLLCLLILYPFLPESPRFLAVKGDLQGLNALLKTVARYNNKPPLQGRLRLKKVPSSDEIAFSSISMQSFSFKKKFRSDSSELGGDGGTAASGKSGWARLPKGGGREGGGGSNDGSSSFNDRLDDGEAAAVGGGGGGGGHKRGETALDKVLEILSPDWRVTTILIWIIFVGCAFSYYGIVLFTTEMALQQGNRPSPQGIQPLWRKECHFNSTGNGDGECTGKGLPAFGNTEYGNIMAASFAELPGLLLAAVLVQKVTRRVTLASFFLAEAVVLAPFFLFQSKGFTTFSLFIARSAVSGAFTTAYIYTPEVYPTTVRSTGLGMAAGMARLGGLICPYVAIALVEDCHEAMAIAIFIIMAGIAATASLCLPIETKGKKLTDFLGETPSALQMQMPALQMSSLPPTPQPQT